MYSFSSKHPFTFIPKIMMLFINFSEVDLSHIFRVIDYLDEYFKKNLFNDFIQLFHNIKHFKGIYNPSYQSV